MSDYPSDLPWLRSQARTRLDCQVDEVGSWIDRIGNCLHRSGIATAYLSPQRGSLLSNITVLENLWLPLAWHSPSPFPCDRLNRMIMDIVAKLPKGMPFNTLDWDSFLASYPDDLIIQQYYWAILLRAALLRPRCLVIDATWFFSAIPGDCCVAPDVMDALFGSAAWLVLGPYATPLAGHWNWAMLTASELSFACRSQP